MENTTLERISEIRKSQQLFFSSGVTRNISFRRERLKAFYAALQKWEARISEALWTDLHKSYEEAYLTEISIVMAEIKSHIRHLRRWSRPTSKCTPLKMFPSRSKVISEPLGTALIIAPWNYPVQLLLNPLVGAISAGCTAVLKPSPYVPNVSAVIEQMIRETFDERHVAVVQGNRTVNQALLDLRWDKIFFTGSPKLGRLVMEAASKNLTPVVLELGGKSPCIIDADADIRVAAKRVAWGKLLNAGQTCIAPDYLMLHESVKESFLKELKRQFDDLLENDPTHCRHFVRIVSDAAFERLTSYLSNGDIVFGGNTDREQRFFEPTVLDHVSPDAPVMQEEIFGPIFPIVTFKEIDEAVRFIVSREKPLALYYFGKKGKHVLDTTSSGGACINDTIMHIVNDQLPFGGVGNSGMSAYHGKLSFDAFSHSRAVVTTTTLLDIPFRYMPYKTFKLVKKIL